MCRGRPGEVYSVGGGIELGYRPQVAFRKGLADTIRSYADNLAWWEPLKLRQ